jgi:hypothetical protein
MDDVCTVGVKSANGFIRSAIGAAGRQIHIDRGHGVDDHQCRHATPNGVHYVIELTLQQRMWKHDEQGVDFLLNGVVRRW